MTTTRLRPLVQATHRVFQHATDQARACTGGDYTYGETVYADWYTGQMLHQEYWCSAEFPFCPVLGTFGCSCENHLNPYAAFQVVDMTVIND